MLMLKGSFNELVAMPASTGLQGYAQQPQALPEPASVALVTLVASKALGGWDTPRISIHTRVAGYSMHGDSKCCLESTDLYSVRMLHLSQEALVLLEGGGLSDRDVINVERTSA